MFISRLRNVVESYDRYGVHRLNGVKVVYILIILYTFNFVFTIPNPYFYFFYLPITTMGAEMIGETVKDKYFTLFSCILISIVTVFLFDIFSISPFFFIFALFYSVFIYFSAINNRNHRVIVAPIALSLGAYSLLYKEINTSFYIVLNNCITTIFASLIIFAALVVFPRGYYYRLWLRAFLLLLDQTIDYLLLMQEQQRTKFDPVRSHTTQLVRFTKLIPSSYPLYSILKINLLVNELHLQVCVTDDIAIIMEQGKFRKLINELLIFKAAVEKEQPCVLRKTSLVVFDKLITSWNYLCLKI